MMDRASINIRFRTILGPFNNLKEDTAMITTANLSVKTHIMALLWPTSRVHSKVGPKLSL